MRAYPIGVLSDINEVMEKAAIQASITHNTKEGILSSQAIALMSFFTIHKLGVLKNLPEFLQDQLNTKWTNNWTGEVPIDGIKTVEAVMTILSKHNGSMSKMLIDSVNLGGDVDTVASLVLAIASNSDEIINDLPQWLYNDLENESFGLGYLKNLDLRLKP